MTEIERGQVWTNGEEKLTVQQTRVNLIDVEEESTGDEVAVPRRNFTDGTLWRVENG